MAEITELVQLALENDSKARYRHLHSGISENISKHKVYRIANKTFDNLHVYHEGMFFCQFDIAFVRIPELLGKSLALRHQ